MAQAYCDDCFENATGKETAEPTGTCWVCKGPVVTAPYEKNVHAIPMTRELAREIRAVERGMAKRDGLEED